MSGPIAVRRVIQLPDAAYSSSSTVAQGSASPPPTIAPLPTGIVESIFGYLALDDVSQCGKVCRFWWTLAEFSSVWRDALAAVHPFLVKVIGDRLDSRRDTTTHKHDEGRDEDEDDEEERSLVPWRFEAMRTLARRGHATAGSRGGAATLANTFKARRVTNYCPLRQAPHVFREPGMAFSVADAKRGWISSIASALWKRLAPPGATLIGDAADEFMNTITSGGIHRDRTLAATTGFEQADFDGVRLTAIVDQDMVDKLSGFIASTACLIFATRVPTYSTGTRALPDQFTRQVRLTKPGTPIVVFVMGYESTYGVDCSAQVIEWSEELNRVATPPAGGSDEPPRPWVVLSMASSSSDSKSAFSRRERVFFVEWVRAAMAREESI